MSILRPPTGRKKRKTFGQKLQQQPKAGSLPGPPVKNTKVGTGVLPPTRMPGNRQKVGQNKATMDLIEKPIQWSAPKKNTSGNARDGSMYREGIDPKTGEKLHLYAEEAGGIPKEIIRVPKRKPKKLSSRITSGRL